MASQPEGAPWWIMKSPVITAFLVAASVLSVIQAERGLAPQWGIPDPIGEHVHEVELSGWIEVNEPDIRVQSIDIVRDMDGSVAARVRATWAGRG